MKRTISLILALTMLVGLCSCADQPSQDNQGNPDSQTAAAFTPEGFEDWFISSKTWMTVDNGHWSDDPADQMTDEELLKVMQAATLLESAGGGTSVYLVAVKDVEAQRSIIGEKYCPVEDSSTPGTVTILVLADSILSNEEGRLNEKAPDTTVNNKNYNFAFLDAGTVVGTMLATAATMGYYGHVWGSNVGENAPFDLGGGKWQSMSQFVESDAMGHNGYWDTYGTPDDELNSDYATPIRGNYVLTCAVVLGKPLADEVDSVSFATNHARPARYTIWDGTYNEEPLPNTAYAEDFKKDAVAGENEYIGTGTGVGGALKVKVTLDNDKISAVEVISHQETDGIGTKAIEDLPAAIVSANSTEVDNVASATITSEAIKEAVEDAIRQSK